jgi:hypothetical protein
MGVLLTIIFSLALWVIAWGVGIKAFDALMVVMLLVLMACAARIMSPYLPGNRQDPDEPSSGGSWLSR